MRLAGFLNIYRNRALRAYAGSLGISMTADFGFVTVVPIQAARVLGAPAAGLVLALNVAPTIIAGTYLSTYADRLPRRAVMLATEGARALAMILLVLFPQELWSLMTVALATGILSTLNTAVRKAVLPSLVMDGSLQGANAAATAASAVGQLLGPVAAGLIMDYAGAAVAYAAVAAGYLAATLALLPIPNLPAAAPATRRGRPALTQLHVMTLTVPRMLIITGVTFCLAGGALNLLEMMIAEGLFQGGATGYGLLITAWGWGSLLGSVLLGSVAMPQTLMVYASSLLAIGAVVIMFGVVPQLWMVVALSAAGGIASAWRTVTSTMLMQQHTPDSLRGRAFGLLLVTGGAAMSASYLATGPLIAAVGVRVSCLIAGGVIAATAPLVPWLVRKAPARREGAPEASSDVPTGGGRSPA